MVRYTVEKAVEAGITPHKAIQIVSRESGWNTNAKGDMDIICENPNSPFHGKPVEARGAWQLTKCYYPQVTDAQAYDFKWATDYVFAMGLLRDGVCEKQFSTCRNL